MSPHQRNRLIKKVFSLTSGRGFENVAMELFSYQSQKNPVYNAFISHLGINPGKVRSLQDIPSLPVSLFKTQKVLTSGETVKLVFRSSRTTSAVPSCHYLTDISLYRNSLLKCFEHFYGDISQYSIFALLPSYAERDDSSLAWMASELISKSAHPESGFYLNNTENLVKNLEKRKPGDRRAIFLGVSFALLDLAEKHNLKLENTIIIETGGMKGRRKEIVREELHSLLKKGFGVKNIHSEYGMTEMLSQAYSRSGGKFKCPPWMKVMIRDPYDPFKYLPAGKGGGVNVIDLANIDSCAFLETSDLGRILPDGKFEINGRLDNSDIRGCNLLV